MRIAEGLSCRGRFKCRWSALEEAATASLASIIPVSAPASSRHQRSSLLSNLLPDKEYIIHLHLGLWLNFLHTYLAWTLAIMKAGCLEELRALHSAQKLFY